MYLHMFMLAVFGVFINGQQINECRRGVKRPHPTQENAYQIFSRNGRRTQWLDQECPQFQIYDQGICACADGYRPIFSTTNIPPPSTTWTPATPAPTVVDEAGGQTCDFHQPIQGSPSLYLRRTENGWVTEDCNWPFYTGLIWDQSTCRCEWGPDRTFTPRRVNSNQAIPAPCLVMLNMTFDHDIVDDARGLWLKRSKPDNAHVVNDNTAVGGACARFEDSSVAIPFFKSNNMGKAFHISFRFRECKGNPSQEITLIHNGCDEVSRLPPTLRVAYRPWSREFTMEFEAENDVQPTREGCTLTTNTGDGGWNNVDIIYENNFLEVSVNNAVCIGSSVFSGDIKTTDCPLSLPGDGACVHLDEVVITRGCQDQ